MTNPIALIVPGLVAATLASAQPATPSESEPLRGPDITAPGPAPADVDAPANMEQPPRGAAFPRGAMFNAMHKAIAGLGSPDAPEELRLTEAQAESLAVLRKEMRAKFESGTRPMRGERPMARAMEILTAEQIEYVRAEVRASVGERFEKRGDAEGARRGFRGFERGPRAGGPADRPGGGRLDPEQVEMLRSYRQLSPEAKARVRAFIEQEIELAKQRDGVSP